MPRLSAEDAKRAELALDFPERQPSVYDDDGSPYPGPNADWSEQ